LTCPARDSQDQDGCDQTREEFHAVKPMPDRSSNTKRPRDANLIAKSTVDYAEADEM
jgi:hypothetical protein